MDFGCTYHLACSQAVDDVVAAKHVSDAMLEAHGIGLGRVTKRGGGRREREGAPDLPTSTRPIWLTKYKLPPASRLCLFLTGYK